MDHVIDRTDHDAPWNQDENPRCGTCDEQMEERGSLLPYLICINPDCEECDPKLKPAVGDDDTCANCQGVIVYGQDKQWHHHYEDDAAECSKPQLKRTR